MVGYKLNSAKILIKRGGGMCPMKPGNRLVIEMVPIHIKLITLEDERKMNQCFLNFAKVRKHF